MSLQFADSDGVGAAPTVFVYRFLSGPVVDQVFNQESTSTSYWLLADHLGTTREVIDDYGTLKRHYEFDAYGRLLSSVWFPTFLLFTGREYDSLTGLYYVRARWYDPEVGRWISEDPIGFAGGDTNLSRYVGNSPVNYTDPTGLDRDVVIYIDPTDLPTNFNPKNIAKLMEQVLAKAGAKVNILIILTSNDVSDELDFCYDRQSWFSGMGWYWNLNPVQLQANTGNYFLYYLTTRNVVRYTQFVQFKTKAQNMLSFTSGCNTTLYPEGIKRAAASVARADWDITYANILLHEVFWLGLLGYIDDPSADLGTLGIRYTDSDRLMDITPEQGKKINGKLDIEVIE